MGALIGLLSQALPAIGGFFTKRQENRAAADSAKAKLATAQLEGKQQVELSELELQRVRTVMSGGTWKDEFVVLVVSAPILLALAGGLVTMADPATGQALVNVGYQMAALMTGEEVEYPTIWLLVVSACLGLRAVKK